MQAPGMPVSRTNGKGGRFMSSELRYRLVVLAVAGALSFGIVSAAIKGEVGLAIGGACLAAFAARIFLLPY